MRSPHDLNNYVVSGKPMHALRASAITHTGLSRAGPGMQIREDNATLKRLVADLWLDRYIFAEQIVQKALYSRRELGLWRRAVFALSGRRAAGLSSRAYSTWLLPPRPSGAGSGSCR